MKNLIMTKTVEVTMVGRVREIEENDGILRISMLYSTREYFLEKNKTELLQILENSKNKEKPVIVVFDGKTGLILKAGSP